MTSVVASFKLFGLPGLFFREIRDTTFAQHLTNMYLALVGGKICLAGKKRRRNYGDQMGQSAILASTFVSKLALHDRLGSSFLIRCFPSETRLLYMGGICIIIGCFRMPPSGSNARELLSILTLCTTSLVLLLKNL